MTVLGFFSYQFNERSEILKQLLVMSPKSIRDSGCFYSSLVTAVGTPRGVYPECPPAGWRVHSARNFCLPLRRINNLREVSGERNTGILRYAQNDKRRARNDNGQNCFSATCCGKDQNTPHFRSGLKWQLPVILYLVAANLSVEIWHKTSRAVPAIQIDILENLAGLTDSARVRSGIGHKNFQMVQPRMDMVCHIENIG